MPQTASKCVRCRAFAAKKTSRSCMGLSDVRKYCYGVALRYAAYRSAAIKYDTHLRPRSVLCRKRPYSTKMEQICCKTSMCFIS